MINANANDFLDYVYSMQEAIHIYNQKKYCIQGWNKDGMVYLDLQEWEPTSKTIWQYKASNILECRNEYLKTPLYDGKTFWEAEKDMEWVDD